MMRLTFIEYCLLSTFMFSFGGGVVLGLGVPRVWVSFIVLASIMAVSMLLLIILQNRRRN